MKKVLNCIIIVVIFISCSEITNKNIEIKGVKLNSKVKVTNEIKTILGKNYKFNTFHLQNNISYRISARSVDKRGRNRIVDFSETENLIKALEEKFNISFKTDGAVTNEGVLLSGNYKAEIEGVAFNVGCWNSNVWKKNLYSYEHIGFSITDIELEEKFQNEKKKRIKNDI